MNYYIRGKGSITFSQHDFICEGGEGRVYGRGNTVYKIYADPKKMIAEGKIAELNTLINLSVIVPEDIILDSKNRPVGFTSRWVKDSWALCKLFTLPFRDKNQISDEQIRDLILKIKKVISFIHSRHCLLVDGNEMNYLVDSHNCTIPYFIDVNSYQTPSYPATALMLTVKDHHTQGFNQLSDWFGFAMIACQLLIGIHPYKGKHPNYQRAALETRMKDNVSIFNPQVSVPRVVKPLDSIPENYRAWLRAVCEDGQRLAPPDHFGPACAVVLLDEIIKEVRKFNVTEIQSFIGSVKTARYHAGTRVVTTDQHVYIGSKPYTNLNKNALIVFTDKNMSPVSAEIKHGNLLLIDARTSQQIGFSLAAQELFLSDNTLYVRNGENLAELRLTDIANNIIPAVVVTWKVLPNATQLFDGFLIQNVFGKMIMTIPYKDENRTSKCLVKPVPELDSYKIISGKHERGVCMLTGYKGSRLNRITLKFDSTYTVYQCQIDEDIDSPTVNFAVLDTGVVINITDEEVVELFRREPESRKVKQITGSGVDSRVRLFSEAGTAMFYYKNKVYSMTMREEEK